MKKTTAYGIVALLAFILVLPVLTLDYFQKNDLICWLSLVGSRSETKFQGLRHVESCHNILEKIFPGVNLVDAGEGRLG